MKRFNSAALGLLLASGLAFAAPQANALIISATPTDANHVDIVASDMDNLISGFDILVQFSDSAPIPTYLLDPNDSLLTSLFFYFDDSVMSTGQAHLVFNSLEADADLFAAQCFGGTCGPITLARLTFAEYDISNLVFSFDWSAPHAVACEQLAGTANAPLARQCYPTTATPEPGTLALLGLGILGMAVGRRRRES